MSQNKLVVCFGSLEPKLEPKQTFRLFWPIQTPNRLLLLLLLLKKKGANIIIVIVIVIVIVIIIIIIIIIISIILLEGPGLLAAGPQCY